MITNKERYQAGHTDLVLWLRSRGETLKKSGSEWEWDDLTVSAEMPDLKDWNEDLIVAEEQEEAPQLVM